MPGMKRTRFDDETLELLEQRLESIAKVIRKTRNGSSMISVMRNENLNINKTRSILYKLLNIKTDDDTSTDLTLQDVRVIIYTPVEKLYKDIFGYNDTTWANQPITLPADAEETLMHLINTILTPREKTTIMLYYFAEQTLNEVAEQMNFSRENPRRIIKKAIQKLRDPSHSNILKIGLKEHQIREAEKAKINEELRTKYLNAYKEEQIQNYQSNFLNVDIEYLKLSVRSYNCTRRSGYTMVKDLFIKTESELLEMRNLGKRSTQEIETKIENLLRNCGLSYSEMIHLKEGLTGKKLHDDLWAR